LNRSWTWPERMQRQTKEPRCRYFEAAVFSRCWEISPSAISPSEISPTTKFVL
jgi:hypothetical protein